MTSRDGYNRNRPTRGSSQPPRDPQRRGSSWELDADELDRYMSGQPSREPRFDPYGRSQSTGRTERVQPQRRQSQPSQPQYDDFDNYADKPEPEPADQWDDDFGYDDDYGYEEYQPEPEPAPVARQQSRRQQRPAPRQQPEFEPDYDDDLYDDPYVLDDEDAPRRPQRRSPRSPRSREARQAPGFTVPPVIAEAPFVKDRLALGMFGVAAFSAILMLIVVMTRRDGLDSLIYTHVNANGEPANLQDASAIWNLPLIAGMVTLISVVLAWFLARWSQFLPRFLMGGAIGVQFVVWVAVIAYLF